MIFHEEGLKNYLFYICILMLDEGYNFFLPKVLSSFMDYRVFIFLKFHHPFNTNKNG